MQKAGVDMCIRVLLLCFLLGCSSVHAETIIKGSVLGEDGKPLPHATAQIFRPSQEFLVGVETDRAGNFQLTVQDKGFFVIKFCGVEHACTTAALSLDESSKPTISARLRRLAFDKIDWSKAQIAQVGPKAGTSPSVRAPFVRQPDGSYLAEMMAQEKESAIAILSGPPAGQNFAPPGATAFREQPNGRAYWAVYTHAALITPIDGKVRVIVNPAKLQSGEKEPEVTGLADDLSHLQEAWRLFELAVNTPAESAKSEEAETQAWNTIARMRATLERELAWINLAVRLPESRKTQENAQKVLEAVRADSPIWGLIPAAILLGEFTVVAGRGAADNLYLDKALNGLGPSLQQGVLFYHFHSLLGSKRYSDALHFAQRMARDYPDFPVAKLFSDKMGGSGMLTIPGKRIPDWEMHDFDNPGKTYTHSSVTSKAQVYLLEFWDST